MLRCDVWLQQSRRERAQRPRVSREGRTSSYVRGEKVCLRVLTLGRKEKRCALLPTPERCPRARNGERDAMRCKAGLCTRASSFSEKKNPAQRLEGRNDGD